MIRASMLALTTVLLFGSATSANAIFYTFAATLDQNEGVPTGSPGTGTAQVYWDDIAHTMRVVVAFQGLLGTTTASHIHAPTPTPLTGTAGVATTTPTFAGFPLGVTSGTFDTTLNMTLTSSYNPAFVTAQGSLAAAEANLLSFMLQGRSYLNIHTSVFGGGEIRGFLVQVPEPGTLSILGLGLGLNWMRRRRSAKRTLTR